MELNHVFATVWIHLSNTSNNSKKKKNENKIGS